MKRTICIVICMILMLTGGAFAENKENEYIAAWNMSETEIMEKAVELLKAAWMNGKIFSFNNRQRSERGDLQILHAQICYFNPLYIPQKKNYLESVYCMVEFTLLTDFYGTAPYYADVAAQNAVLFKMDGTTEVNTTPFYYCMVRYSTEDFMNALIRVTHTDEYNGIYYLLEEE